MDKTEKRYHKRYQHAAPITFSHFSSRPQPAESHYKGVILGHGAGGLQFKSAYALKPGAILLIKLERWDAPNLEWEAYSGMRTISLGQVKWCHPLEDEFGDGDGYMVGVKYFVY